jgi:xanthosine utilization system XapX-like protein
MLKVLFGAAIVVALVGYGVLTPETLEDAGARMKAGINNSAAWVKEKTEPDVLDELKSRLD